MAEYSANEIVDVLDAEYAISTIQETLTVREMSTSDLAVELGWKRKRVEEVLYSPSSIPLRSDFEAIAKVLDIDLELEEE